MAADEVLVPEAAFSICNSKALSLDADDPANQQLTATRLIVAVEGMPEAGHLNKSCWLVVLLSIKVVAPSGGCSFTKPQFVVAPAPPVVFSQAFASPVAEGCNMMTLPAPGKVFW